MSVLVMTVARRTDERTSTIRGTKDEETTEKMTEKMTGKMTEKMIEEEMTEEEMSEEEMREGIAYHHLVVPEVD